MSFGRRQLLSAWTLTGCWFSPSNFTFRIFGFNPWRMLSFPQLYPPAQVIITRNSHFSNTRKSALGSAMKCRVGIPNCAGTVVSNSLCGTLRLCAPAVGPKFIWNCSTKQHHAAKIFQGKQDTKAKLWGGGQWRLELRDGWYLMPTKMIWWQEGGRNWETYIKVGNHSLQPRK